MKNIKDMNFNEKSKLALSTSNKDILEKLSVDEQSIRLCVAFNRNTSEEVLSRLAKDEKLLIRNKVAEHWNAPITALNKLSEDSHSIVRESVAKNHKTPAEILMKLANDDDRDVRKAVLENPNTDPEIVKKLAKEFEIDDLSNQMWWNQSIPEDGLEEDLER